MNEDNLTPCDVVREHVNRNYRMQSSLQYHVGPPQYPDLHRTIKM